MTLKLGKKYIDGHGHVWTVTSVSNGQREEIGPVSAGRWEGDRYMGRIFLRDGRYSVDVPKHNLVKQVL